MSEGYKQTEVGVIPKNWKVQSVGEAFEIRNNLRLPINRKIRESMEGQYPYYGPTNVQGYINEYRVEGEHALIGEDGDHFLKWRDLSMTLLVNGKFNVNNHAHIVRGVKNLTSWFYYFFSHRELTTHLTRQGAGRYKLTKSTLVNIPCAIPPVPEQQAIAQALSDVDALIAALDKLIAKKRNLKTATMQQLLTGKKRLPGFGEGQGYKESALGLIPEDWNVKNIGEDAVTYSGGTPSTGNTEYYFGQIPWITSGDLNKRYILEVNGRISEKGLNNSSAKMISANTLLIALYGATAGVSAISRIEAAINQAVLAILPRSLDRKYLFYVLGLRKDKIIETFTQGGQPNLSGEIIRSLLIAASTPHEQRAIATVLSDMDAEITALETRLTKTQAIKQGMMQQLLTGKTRLV